MGMIRNAIATFEQMDQLGVEGTVKSLNALLTACIVGEKYDDVHRIYVDFPKLYAIKPNFDTYELAIQAFSESGEEDDDVDKLFNMMEKRRIKPEVGTFNVVIQSLCKITEAKWSFEDMVSRGIKPKSDYYTLVDLLCQGGDYDIALLIFKVCVEKKLVPSFTMMKSLLEGLASISKAEEARDIIVRVKEKFPKRADLCKEAEDALLK
ncbi:hypothetical protein Ancab_033506 [Ancistrocladus abbreviatus]